MNTNNKAIVIGLAMAMLILMIPTGNTVDADGTRAGEVGWQYEAFAENLLVQVSPEDKTTLDTITVTITSKVDEVYIKQASLWLIIYPNEQPQYPYGLTFFKMSDTVFQCEIPPFPHSGYRIDFYIVAYDYDGVPMDSRNSLIFSYDVVGSGWKHNTFDDNIILEYWPMRANATEEVTITLRSVDNITISGANLYVTYETPEGDIREGGWNFSKANANSTEMRRVIPGYPAGTNVTFWVTAWDQYTILITSRMYNYSVMGISEYTDFPFEYTEGDRSVWIPDDSILLPMAGMSALAIPLFIYLYALDLKRRRKAVDLVKTKPVPEEKEVASDE